MNRSISVPTSNTYIAKMYDHQLTNGCKDNRRKVNGINKSPFFKDKAKGNDRDRVVDTEIEEPKENPTS